MGPFSRIANLVRKIARTHTFLSYILICLVWPSPILVTIIINGFPGQLMETNVSGPWKILSPTLKAIGVDNLEPSLAFPSTITATNMVPLCKVLSSA